MKKIVSLLLIMSLLLMNAMPIFATEVEDYDVGLEGEKEGLIDDSAEHPFDVDYKEFDGIIEYDENAANEEVDEPNNEPQKESISFTDVAPEHWAYKYIDFLTSEGIINGMGDGSFRPNDTLTLGQYIKLVIATNLSENIDMDQVEYAINHWAGQYITLAEEYEIIEEGEVTLENVDKPITREDMVRIVSLADLNVLGNHLITSENDNEMLFNDISELNQYNIDLIYHAVQSKLVNGYPDGSFKPEGFMTRAEASAIIYRFYWIEN